MSAPPSKNEGGVRYNEGKTKHHLVPPFAQEEYSKVLTLGAIKYEDRNWERGLSWTETYASVIRHLNAFMNGEDYDKETGLLHVSHAQAGCSFLAEFYNIYPEGDDRPHRYLRVPKIGLDIDEVIADFVTAYCTKFKIENIPEMWNFDPNLRERMNSLKEDKEFWMNIKPKIKASEIPFEPHCYITSRSIPNEWTKEWIKVNGFPTRPVYSVGGKSKVDTIREKGVDWFVDDRYENFLEISKAGIICFLFDALHNRRYNVGYKRVKTLKDLPLMRK